MSASRMGLSPRFTASTFEGATSSARTSLRCASSTARERPTYPRPATAYPHVDLLLLFRFQSACKSVRGRQLPVALPSPASEESSRGPGHSSRTFSPMRDFKRTIRMQRLRDRSREVGHLLVVGIPERHEHRKERGEGHNLQAAEHGGDLHAANLFDNERERPGGDPSDAAHEGGVLGLPRHRDIEDDEDAEQRACRRRFHISERRMAANMTMPDETIARFHGENRLPRLLKGCVSCGSSQLM